MIPKRRSFARWAWTLSERPDILRIAGGFFIAAGVIILQPGVVASAEIERKIKISIDRHRDCGDPMTRPAIRLKKRLDYTEIDIRSGSYWNASGVILEAGVTYRFEPAENSVWSDASVETDVSGWWPSGWKAWFMAVIRPLLRAPDQNLFQLMGMIYHRCGDGRRDCATQFPIGKAGFTFKPAVSGEFCAYANDLPFKYGNNSGAVSLLIRRQ